MDKEQAQVLYKAAEAKEPQVTQDEGGTNVHAHPIVMNDGNIWGVIAFSDDPHHQEEEAEREYLVTGLAQAASKVQREVDERGSAVRKRAEDVKGQLAQKVQQMSPRKLEEEGRKAELDEQLDELRDDIADVDMARQKLEHYLMEKNRSGNGSLSEIKRYRRPVKEVLTTLLAVQLLIDRGSQRILESLTEDYTIPPHENAQIPLWGFVRRIFKPHEVLHQMKQFDPATTFRSLALDSGESDKSVQIERRLNAASTLLQNLPSDQVKHTSEAAGFLYEWASLTVRLRDAYLREVSYEHKIQALGTGN